MLTDERHEARVAARIPRDVPLYVVPDRLVGALGGVQLPPGHSGVRPEAPLAGADGRIARRGDRWVLVVCPTLNNPENLGAIIRIGDVFGAAAVLIGGPCPDPFSRRVLRVSMGTSLQLPVIVSDGPGGGGGTTPDGMGAELVATVVDPSAEPLDSARRPDRLALFFGSEGEGLAAEWIDRCDRRVTIPMRPGAESLNVAVAAGVVLHHFLRRPS